MTKDEKVFLTGLIKGLERRFDGLEKRMDARFDEHDTRFDGIDKRFEKVEEQLERNSLDIRFQSVQIEFMRDDLAQIKEGDAFSRELNVKVEALMENMGIDLPVLQHTVSNHSKRIKVLESKRAQTVVNKGLFM